MTTHHFLPTTMLSCGYPPHPSTLSSTTAFAPSHPPHLTHFFPSTTPTQPIQPLTIPPDYCIVAFFIVIVISVVQWFVDGRKNYKGPVVELVGDGDEAVYAADDNLDDKVRGEVAGREG